MSTGAISVDLSTGATDGAAAGDQFVSIENMNGTAFDDELDGSAVANILSGNDGDDWLEGYGGDDTLNGGAGDDGLIGDDGNDTMLGGDGDDWFDGGAGNDTMNGGAGDFDEADYYGNLQDYSFTRNADNSVTVVSEKDGSDTLIDLEQIWLYSEDGSSYQIYDLADLAPAQPDDPGQNTITGTSGDDDLTGTSGNDTLDGGLGNDSLNGGDGSDTYLYRLGDGSDGIGDQSASTTDVDTLKFVDVNFTDVTFSPSANDVLATINSTGDVVSIYWQFLDASAGWGLEKILFADGISMDLKHGDVAWQINGTDGNDQITSPMWGSAEIFNGGKGNDFLDGTAGSDLPLCLR
jgi:Ca2+-binding RTX toxin-like protein